METRTQRIDDALQQHRFVRTESGVQWNRCVWGAGEAPRPTQNTLGSERYASAGAPHDVGRIGDDAHMPLLPGRCVP